METTDSDLSSVSPVGLVFLICMALLTMMLPRRVAVIPLMITTCYMPLGQMFVVAGAHIQFFRVLLFLGWFRVLVRGEGSALSLGRMDKIFIWWAIVTLVLGSMTQPTVFSERVINRCGEVFNSVGTFFLIRCWVRNLDEMIGIVKILALMIAPLAISMLVEKFTARNVFSVFGGVPAITVEREGKLRCQGAFRHPIMAGTYGATLFPLFFGLWFQGRGYKRAAAIGLISSAVVTIAAASSGALLAVIGELIAFGLWRYRYKMRLVRRSLLFAIFVLALIMKAPVWYIISRLSDITGGTGWYRSYLIDMAVQHFDEWWLVGTKYTAHWAPAGQVVSGNVGNTDVINNYIFEGLDGGILKLGLFIALIVMGFKIVGRFTYARNPLPFKKHIFAWSLGACLLGHSLSFLSVAYFDQIVVMWYWILASLAMAAFELTKPQPDLQLEEDPGEAFDQLPAR